MTVGKIWIQSCLQTCTRSKWNITLPISWAAQALQPHSWWQGRGPKTWNSMCCSPKSTGNTTPSARSNEVRRVQYCSNTQIPRRTCLRTSDAWFSDCFHCACDYFLFFMTFQSNEANWNIQHEFLMFSIFYLCIIWKCVFVGDEEKQSRETENISKTFDKRASHSLEVIQSLFSFASLRLHPHPSPITVWPPPAPYPGLQIRGSEFQSWNSKSRELELTNLLGLVLGCIEAKFCK